MRDRWELYHLDRDFAEIDDRAGSEPDRLRALVDLWWVEAGKYGVLPLDDRDWERAAARLRMNTTTRYEYLGNMARVDRLSAPDISDRGYSIAAEFEPAAAVTEGVLLAWGSRFAGFVLYIKDGELRYQYVYSESIKYTLRAPFNPRAGKTLIRLIFQRTGPKAGRVQLMLDDSPVGSVEIPRTWPTHGTTAGLNCGQDAGAPVTDAYQRPFHFTGRNLRVIIDLEGANGGNLGAPYQTVLREQ